MQFDKISYQEWEEKLRKELKTEDLSVFRHQIAENISFSPFDMPVDRPEAPSTKHKQSIQIGVFFRLSPKELNSAMMHLVNYDLRSVKVDTISALNEISLRGVFPEMIFWDISDDIQNGQEVLDSLRFENGKPLNNVSANIQNNVQGAYRRVNIEKDTDALAIIKKCRDIWSDNYESESGLKSCVSLPVKENLLEVIPLIRAIRLLWQEYNLSNDDLRIEARIAFDDVDSNEILIRVSSLAMICQMAGADVLYAGAMDNLTQLDHFTHLLNIQNIVSLESHAGSVEDPLKGSYAIESITEKLLQFSQ